MRVRAHPLNLKSEQGPLASFLGMSFRDPRVFTEAKQNVDNHVYPRERLANILTQYNHSLGADTLSLLNAEKLASSNSYCVVTGQQLGMMGGPIYTILKGITCLLVAKQTGAIPIFWLATEDHDSAEIDHTHLIDAMGNLKRFHLSLAKDGTAVEEIKLTEKNVEEIDLFWTYLGCKEKLPLPGHLYSDSMIQILIRLFAGTGIVFLEPKLLRPLAIPFFSREINNFQAIQNALKDTTRRLQEAGGKPVISVGKDTNLFLKDRAGKRLKIRFDGQHFIAGSVPYALNDLLSKIEKEPESFSPNVAARPVLQNSLLPVIAYIAGPSEFAYHYQLSDYHQLHGINMPCLIPRLSATFIPPFAASIMDAVDLKPWNAIPRHWQDLLPTLEGGTELMTAQWFESALEHFENDLSASAIERYVKQGAKKLIHRIYKARLNKRGLPSHGLHLLRNLIYPHDHPQERLLNWLGFQVKSQENLVGQCLEQLSWDLNAHYYIYL